MIETERKTVPEVLLLEAGNTLTGRGLADATKGAAVIEAMNRMGYTAMALGEVELQLGVQTLEARIREAKFPVLAANVTVKATGKPLTQPYTIVQAGQLKVGILGLTNDNAANITTVTTGAPQTPVNVGDQFVIADSLKTAAAYVPEIAAQSDLVIVLSHLGLDADRKLAQQVPGIDVIVGGQTRRIIVPPQAEQDTLIVQAGYDGEWLGMLRLQLDGKGRIGRYEGQAPALGPDYPDHAEMARWLEEAKRAAQ